MNNASKFAPWLFLGTVIVIVGCFAIFPAAASGQSQGNNAVYYELSMSPRVPQVSCLSRPGRPTRNLTSLKPAPTPGPSARSPHSPCSTWKPAQTTRTSTLHRQPDDVPLHAGPQ